MQHTERMRYRLTLRHALAALAASFAFVFAAPISASAHDNFSFDGFSFDHDEDLLEDLVALDADDIDELRDEMREAQSDIKDAINDIREAREDVRDAPGGGAIMKVALSSASVIVSASTKSAFKEARRALERAEADLSDQRSALGEAEFAETTMAIEAIRDGIAGLEVALGELLAEMRA